MWRRKLVVAAALLAAIPGVYAQTRTVEDDQDLINWYYAATYGTGIYTAGDRTVGVLKIPLSRTLWESTEDRWGLRLILPVTLGVYDFSFDSVVEGVREANRTALAAKAVCDRRDGMGIGR